MPLDLKAIQQKGSPSDGEDDREGRRQARDGAFRAKIAIQQFMNHNAPLFRAFAKAGVPTADLVDGDALKAPAEAAMRLALLVAARVMAKDPGAVTAAEMAPFRTEASTYVAARWLDGEDANVDEAAAAIAGAALLAGPAWDHDAYKDGGVGGDASLAMTAAGIAGTLARAVEVYDFRQGRAEVLGRLVTTVAEASAGASREMLPQGSDPSDLRNLTQTVARNLSTLMEACYERRAREVVALLGGRPAAERQRWLAANDPVGQVLADFGGWALCFGGFALAASREMSPRPRHDQAERSKDSHPD